MLCAKDDSIVGWPKIGGDSLCFSIKIEAFRVAEQNLSNLINNMAKSSALVSLISGSYVSQETQRVSDWLPVGIFNTVRFHSSNAATT